MSLWLDKEDELAGDPPATMTDVSFKIDCQQLPVDHAAALADSLCKHQAWLKELPHCGVHPVHIAGSQNGWQCPDQRDEHLLLSKRTRLKIRVPLTDANRLIGGLRHSRHRIGNQQLEILDGRIVHLTPTTTLFSRHTIYLQEMPEPDNESVFIEHVVTDCARIGFRPTKVLCGKSVMVSTAHGTLSARRVLLADIPLEHSLKLQDKGLGDLRLMGCGLLIPHKDTAAVS